MDNALHEEVEKARKSSGTELEPGRSYGRWLAEKIRLETEFSNRTAFQKFVVDYGFEYETMVELNAAYDRGWKAQHSILISEEEFLTEARQQDNKITRNVYSVLVGLVNDRKLSASKVYQYARFKWCLKNAAAIKAYECDSGEWVVNNCDTEISERKSKIKVNEEWHFEADWIKIIGTSYYDATDWQFIRFDTGNMAWLWSEGNLYQVIGN